MERKAGSFPSSERMSNFFRFMKLCKNPHFEIVEIVHYLYIVNISENIDVPVTNESSCGTIKHRQFFQ